MHQLTIIMYHYIRELPFTRYPNIKALLTSHFKKQISYLIEHHSIISGEDCMNALIDEKYTLPPNPALLTFDDGYKDHFETVFPILNNHQIPGCFFAPVKTVKNRGVLDVNKIHFILAAVKSHQKIIEIINEQLLNYKDAFELEDPSYYYKKLAITGRYDSKEIIFIKRLLQKGLPVKLRKKITDYLFREFVTADEEAFARELYMSMDQVKCMIQNGMYFGGHGYDHLWMDQLSTADQENEIDQTIAFLNEVGAPTDAWMMCYPYGAYSKQLIELLRKKSCIAGLTTEFGYASLNPEKAFSLARFDANDLQKTIEGKSSLISEAVSIQ